MAKSKRARKRDKQKPKPAKPKAQEPQTVEAKYPRFLGVEFDRETNYRLVYFAALFNGGFLVAGMVLDEFLHFSIIMGVIMAAFYCGLSESGQRERVRITNRFALLYMAQLALCFLFFSLTKDAISTALLILCAVCMLLHQSLAIKHPRQLLLLIFAIPIEMVLFMLLGVRSQLGYLFWPTAWLALSSGTVLSAYLVLEHISVLEEAGWQRAKQHTDKKGNSVLRPLGISRVYSLMLMFGLSAVLIASTLQFMPRLFVGLGLLMIPIPKIAAAFLNKSESLDVLKHQTLRLAIWVTMGTLVLTQIARSTH